MNKLSEDEIIKGITNIIYTCNEIIEDTDWYDEEEIKSAKEQSKLTQGLLDLYQQEKEKNGILQKELDKKIEALDKAMNNPDYISKDKIRELLKVIQKEKDIATKNILERDYNLAENGAICQELGYIEGELKKLLED